MILISKVTILEETTKYPITLIGKRAGICWGADVSDDRKNYARGLNCLRSNHGRTLEYPTVEMVIEDCSARVIREWYTHVGGSPTRLQSSTRYINYDEFNYQIPSQIKKNAVACKIYENSMGVISDNIKFLEECGISREDSAMLLPLGMDTKIVDKRNLRNLIDMFNTRSCTRAYKEFRDIMRNIRGELSQISDEWMFLAKYYFVPKCVRYGYCVEKNSCGQAPTKSEVFSVLKEHFNSYPIYKYNKYDEVIQSNE